MPLIFFELNRHLFLIIATSTILSSTVKVTKDLSNVLQYNLKHLEQLQFDLQLDLLFPSRIHLQ